jgi:hypothetical protein
LRPALAVPNGASTGTSQWTLKKFIGIFLDSRRFQEREGRLRKSSEVAHFRETWRSLKLASSNRPKKPSYKSNIHTLLG